MWTNGEKKKIDERWGCEISGALEKYEEWKEKLEKTVLRILAVSDIKKKVKEIDKTKQRAYDDKRRLYDKKW